MTRVNASVQYQALVVKPLWLNMTAEVLLMDFRIVAVCTTSFAMIDIGWPEPNVIYSSGNSSATMLLQPLHMTALVVSAGPWGSYDG